jgi:hypothetical protein
LTMKTISSLLAAFAGAAALAQAPFTIVRPQDGSTVRETVNITMPKNSVPQGSFIGISVDGKFLEATVPTLDAAGKYLVYKLDTKAKKISDGEHTIGITLYSSGGGRAAAADKSEVRVKVGNHTGINVPNEGLLIRYKWRVGSQNTYGVSVGQEISTLSEAQNRRGGRAAQLPLGNEFMRMLFACDDVKPGGIGVIRSQLLPYVGKDYLVVSHGAEGPKVHKANEFAAIYRLLRTNGQEEYGDVPNWWGFPGTSGYDSTQDLLAFIPLPILPTERLQVGDSWQANIAVGSGDIAAARNRGRTIEKIPARGTFEAVEWEQGKPCARLKYELEFANRSRETGSLQIAGREFKDNDKLRYEETAWISLDDGKLVRADLVIEADTKVAAPEGGGNADPGMGGGMPTGGPQPAGGRGGRGGPRPMGGGGERDNQQGPQPFGSGGGGRGGGFPGGGQTPPGGGGNSGIFVRSKIYIKMALEK